MIPIYRVTVSVPGIRKESHRKQGTIRVSHVG